MQGAGAKVGGMLRSGLLLSLAVHLGVLAWLMIGSLPPRVDPPRALEVTLVDPPEAALPRSKRGGAGSRIDFSRGNHVGKAMLSEEPGPLLGSSRDGFATAQMMGIEEESRLYPFFSAIWKRIDGVTRYPQEFVHERLEGEVLVHFEVSREGRFTGRFFEVRAQEEALRLYSMVLILHALRTPLSQKLWADRDRITLVARFHYSLFGPGEDPAVRIEDPQYFKNLLSIERRARAEPVINDVIRDLMRKNPVPVYPISGGIFVDLGRVYSMLTNEELSVDPKGAVQSHSARRIEAWMEKWRAILQSGMVGS